MRGPPAVVAAYGTTASPQHACSASARGASPAAKSDPWLELPIVRFAGHRSDARVEGTGQFMSSYGVPLVGCYAMAARRHMHEFGTTSEQLAEIAVGVREFASFNPLARYRDLLQTIDRLGLVEQVAPIQLAIRLLVTEGSRLLELGDVRSVIQPFDPSSLTYPWQHRDRRVDDLQRAVMTHVGVSLRAPRAEIFDRVWTLAHEAAGLDAARRPPLPSRATIPYLNEPWYC